MSKNSKIIPRDISWLAFNARVLQEAADNKVPLRERKNSWAFFPITWMNSSG
jgi:polyphosphate kinase